MAESQPNPVCQRAYSSLRSLEETYRQGMRGASVLEAKPVRGGKQVSGRVRLRDHLQVEALTNSETQ